MTLTKAIELAKESEKSLRKGKFIDHADAVMICIESAERCQLARKETSFVGPAPLPSETEE